MTVVTKTVEAGVAPVDSENPHGEFDVILSTDALDRDGERLYLDEWKQPLPDHITIDSDHDMSVVSTVGSGRPFINEAGQLQVRGTFASTPHAQNVRTLVNEGHIKTVSVAFRVEKNTKEGSVKRELLNAGFVAVPANPEAVVLSSKAAKVEEPSKEQLIREAAVQLGEMAAELIKLMDYDEEKSAPVVEDDEKVDEIDDDLPAEVEGDDDEEDDDDKTSSRKAGSPQEAAAAAAEKSAAAAAVTEANLQRARALAFLMKKTAEL